MSHRPFRFLHAADLHLEQPAAGLAEAPDYLAELLIDCPLRAATRLFDAALSEHVDFALLAGDVIDPRRSSARELLFLVEQFERLAERNIAVYWAGGAVDSVDDWPPGIVWPRNVRILSRTRLDRLRHESNGTVLCEIIGRAHDAYGPPRLQEFVSSSSDLFSIALAHADWTAEALADAGVRYWALGGTHQRRTPLEGRSLAHYAGTPQGRRPSETGTHGVTLVSVDEQQRVRLTPLNIDVVRWHSPHLSLGPNADRNELERLLRERTQKLLEDAGGAAVMLSWKLITSGALFTALRRGQLTASLLNTLRGEFGRRTPAAYTVALEAELPEQLPAGWYEEDTIRGDFLREVRRHLLDDPHDRDPLLTAADLPSAGASSVSWAAVSLDLADVRRAVLREAAWLGADLLSPEEATR